LKALAAHSGHAFGIRLRSISVIFGKSKMLPFLSGEDGLSEKGLRHIPLSRRPGEATTVIGTVASPGGATVPM